MKPRLAIRSLMTKSGASLAGELDGRVDQGSPQSMKRLDPTVARRVVRAVDWLANEGQGHVKKLKGSDDLLRLRVGDCALSSGSRWSSNGCWCSRWSTMGTRTAELRA